MDDREASGDLLWLETRALDDLGRAQEAAQRACETLEVQPENVEAAQMLAARLGLVGDWGRAVTQLERALDVSHPPAATAAKLWEAIGRAYAGPLENIERAQRCYRRALEANPSKSSAHEALADITAFDPDTHRESIELHRELLASYPARAGSWRAIARIAEHWRRDLPLRSANIVMSALGLASSERRSDSPSALAIDADPSADLRLRTASELLAELGPGSAGIDASASDLPVEIRDDVLRASHGAWVLSDEALQQIWSRPPSEEDDTATDLLRRMRRRVWRAPAGANDLRGAVDLDPRTWRIEILAEGAARAIHARRISVRSALVALLRHWPDTSHLEVSDAIELGAAVQACPPARALLHRLARAALDGLGMS